MAAIVILAWPVNYYVRAPLVLLPDGRGPRLRHGRRHARHRAARRPHGRRRTSKSPNSTTPTSKSSSPASTANTSLHKLRLDNLEKLRGDDPEANAKIPATSAAVDDLARQLADRRHDAERLTLVAPTSGIVIPAPSLETRRPKDGRLPTLVRRRSRRAKSRRARRARHARLPRRRSAETLRRALGERHRRGPTRHRPASATELDQLPGQVLTGEVVDVARRDPQTSRLRKMTARADLAPLFAGLMPRRDEKTPTTKSASASTTRTAGARHRRPRPSEDRRRADHARPLARPLFRPDLPPADVSHDLERLRMLADNCKRPSGIDPPQRSC